MISWEWSFSKLGVYKNPTKLFWDFDRRLLYSSQTLMFGRAKKCMRLKTDKSPTDRFTSLDP